MRSNPLWQGARAPSPWRPCREALLAAILAVIVRRRARAAQRGAAAGLASITFRAVPLARRAAHARELAGPVRPRRPSLARRAARVRFSVRSTGGRWGPWLDAAAEEEDQPDAGSPEARSTRGWRLGNPTWVGPSNGIRYRITGTVRDLRASFVRSPELRIPLRAVASAGSPPIVPRSAWGADESIRRARSPRYAPTIRFAIVHHTAGTNDYSPRAGGRDHAGDRGLPRQVERLERHRLQLPRRPLRHRLRGPLRRHRPERDRRPRPRLQHRLGRRRGDRHVRRPRAARRRRGVAREASGLATRPRARRSRSRRSPFVSGGSERYRAGAPVVLRAVSGHRDTGLTVVPRRPSCTRRLDAIAAKTQAIGLPKLYEPKVTGASEGRCASRPASPRRCPGR